jgi:hypothetical protein
MKPDIPRVFTVASRDRIHARILEIARCDEQIVAGAVVGSLATGKGDRWSDLDLTFGIAPEASTLEILDRFGALLAQEFGAVHLFDLPHRETLFRVFLLQGCLQVDLSVTPISHFGPYGPNFHLLFGSHAENLSTSNANTTGPPAEQLLGYAVHHAVRARFCIERGRFLQAEYWLSAARDYTLSLACLHRSLPLHYGRGFDQLPEEIRTVAADGLVKSLDRAELLRALKSVVSGLLPELEKIQGNPTSLVSHLSLLANQWDD